MCQFCPRYVSFCEFVFYQLVHPRPRINLDLNFGEKIGGRITVEVGCLIHPLIIVIC